jgi:cellulose synthase/poly-beta-1,6-N-acetylglucosamine synthase-like glycosyltransferase
VIVFHLIVAAVDVIAAVAALIVTSIGAGLLSLPVLFFIQRFRKWESTGALLSEGEPPHVLIQLPVFNERSVVAGLLQSVAKLDWPREKLHIQLLDDSTDGSADIGRTEVDRLKRVGFDAVHVERSERIGYKAGALAAGLALSDAPFVALLDADFRPPPNWLRVVVPRLIADPRAAFVQSRCEFANSDDNWLTRAQGLLLDAHFVMEQRVRERAGMLFQFNGTAGVWRRAAIDAAGGWSTDSLCEDLDLTIRAALGGWHGLFVMDPPVIGLVPDRMRHWRVQQRRWASGFAQIARNLLGAIVGSHWSFAQKLSAVFLILFQAFLPAAAIGLAALGIGVALRGGDVMPFVSPAVLIAILAALVAVGLTLPPYIALRRGGFGRYIRTVLTLPPLVLYLSIANARAIVATFLGRREVFKKTPKSAIFTDQHARGP